MHKFRRAGRRAGKPKARPERREGGRAAAMNPGGRQVLTGFMGLGEEVTGSVEMVFTAERGQRLLL